MIWTRRALLVYPVNAFSEARKDTIAQAFVTHASLETFANERLMFDKAAAYSGDYGATETHRAINTALTPALADALKTALAGASGFWYLLDAATDELLDTNDSAKAGRSTLDWQPGQTVTAGEVLRRNGGLYEVIISHTTQADWMPEEARSLFKRYRAPGEAAEWEQPLGSIDAYPKNARAIRDGKVYVSLIDNNVWQPGAPGSETLWKLETPDEPEEPTVKEWVSGEQGLQIGDLRSWQSVVYRVRQNPGANIWQPPTVPALWTPV